MEAQVSKQRNDETNTLFIVATPDGQVRKAVSLIHVLNILQHLEIAVRVRKEAGAVIDADTIPKLIEDMILDIRDMKDPTVN
jgi:hypothetical protein